MAGKEKMMDTKTLQYMAERVDKGRQILGHIADIERRAKAINEKGGEISIELRGGYSLHASIDQTVLRKFILDAYAQKIEKLKCELEEL